MKKVKTIKLNICYLLLGVLMLAVEGNAAASERVLFSRLSSDSYWQIWQMDADGGSQVQLTYSAGDKREPFFIERDNRLGYRTSNGELFLCSITGEDCQELVAELKPISSPHYAPQTHELVFVRFLPRQADVGDIWKIELETGATKVLSRSRLLSFQPRVTTDGKKIAFIQKNNDRINEIWVMNADGSEQVKVMDKYGRIAGPELSRDKKKILFTSNYLNNDFDLYQVDIASRKVEAVVQNTGLDTSPTYSPDNSWIAFVSNRSGEHQIWASDLSGKKVKQLTFGSPSVDPIWIAVEGRVDD